MRHISLSVRDGLIRESGNSTEHGSASNARSGGQYRESLGVVDSVTFAEAHHERGLRSWGWEIGGCLGSLVSFFAMIGLLAAFDGKPQPAWP